MHGKREWEERNQRGRERREELEVAGAGAEAEDSPRGAGAAAEPQHLPRVCHPRARSGVKRGLTWSDCRAALNYCEWVVSGLPEIFSPAACGVRAETKTKQITGHNQDGPFAATGTSRTSRRKAGAGIGAAACSL